MAFPGTILANKDSATPPRPLLLATFKLYDGTIRRYSTHELTSDAGTQYAGHDYEPRLTEQDLNAIQALADSGVDEVPQVTLHLADADCDIWTNYERPIGFKGASLVLILVQWTVGTADFSTDSLVRFVGICDPPNWDDGAGVWQITATNRLNLQRTLLPVLPIEKRCPWVFPTTAAQRQEAADNDDSPFFKCGYSPDAAGPNARGNGSFTTCNYTKPNCVERGMF